VNSRVRKSIDEKGSSRIWWPIATLGIYLLSLMLPAPARLSHLVQEKVVVAFNPPRNDFAFEIPLSRTEAAGKMGTTMGLGPLFGEGHLSLLFWTPVGLGLGAVYGAAAGAPNARRRWTNNDAAIAEI
jgi:hypothetical protein